ncbi:unnamed protein product [Heligmosomoides polygyrus]|uniref:BPTI/Kunitz inhibitor domain-containing protein n=1 Tax=Heligmosomoides polygyrus TaxID=6339 RepID=A0A3P8DGB2_HELPZ|nr:unnamed protein product [Heligmosomoides polygyrus]
MLPQMRLLLAVIVVLMTIVYCDEICKMKLETGPCRMRDIRYGYSTAEGKCVKFDYGGCKGNENNFETIEECQKKCP